MQTVTVTGGLEPADESTRRSAIRPIGHGDPDSMRDSLPEKNDYVKLTSKVCSKIPLGCKPRCDRIACNASNESLFVFCLQSKDKLRLIQRQFKVIGYPAGEKELHESTGTGVHLKKRTVRYPAKSIYTLGGQSGVSSTTTCC